MNYLLKSLTIVSLAVLWFVLIVPTATAASALMVGLIVQMLLLVGEVSTAALDMKIRKVVKEANEAKA